MNTSGGGGYCDCGDVEAWTSHPSCEIHGVNSQQDQVRSSFSSNLGISKREEKKKTFQTQIRYMLANNVVNETIHRHNYMSMYCNSVKHCVGEI